MSDIVLPIMVIVATLATICSCKAVKDEKDKGGEDKGGEDLFSALAVCLMFMWTPLIIMIIWNYL